MTALSDAPAVNEAPAAAAPPLERALAGRRRPAVALAGAAALTIGCNGPWATFFFGYPGKLTLAGFPGGARVYCLLFVAALPLAFVDVAGRRAAGLAASLGALAIAAGNLLVIAKDGGGLGAVAWGAWTATAGAVLLAISSAALPADRPAVPGSRSWPKPVELALVVLTWALLLELVVYGVNTSESTLFVSFLALVGLMCLALSRLGVLGRLQAMNRRNRGVSVAALVVVAAAFPFTQNGSAYWLRVFASIGVFATAAIGLNVVVGLAGLLYLGYVAFFGVGAYIGGLLANAHLTTVHVHLPFLAVLFVGASVAAIFGLIIGAPTLRLRGDYLAIVTLGFGEIFRITANNWDVLTRGPNGVAGIPDLRLGGFNLGSTHRVLGVPLPNFANYYLVELLLLAVVIVVFTRLNESRIGRAWVAIREDETAAAAMGVNTVRLKLLAFAIGAFLAGASGTLNAHLTGQVSPDSYTFLESILLVAAVVLGGMGTVAGALLGSSVLFVIPEKLRSFQDKRLLLFGLALVLMMRFRPEGMAASRRRQRELHEERATGAIGAPPGAPVGRT